MVPGFVDATDPAAVEAVIAQALASIGPEGLGGALLDVPGLVVVPGTPARLLRPERPWSVGYGEERVSFSRGTAVREHVVGGVRLSSDVIVPVALPGVLASLVTRAVAESGRADEVAVRLTALRDALDAGR